jgi:hypothetical protein
VRCVALRVHTLEGEDAMPKVVTPKGAAPKGDSVYAPAFARVRLVRAWIGVAAATVALCYAFNALLDRMLP